MTKTQDSYRIEWDLHELGPKPPVTVAPAEPAERAYRDVSAQLDFSRLDYARAVAAGYLPANERDIHEHEAA